MNSETFDQVLIDEKLVTNADLMKEGQEVEILINTENDAALLCELPPFVELTVTYSEPGLKGDTANSPKKAIEVETGARIMVPLFIEEGQKIKVDTRTYDYEIINFVFCEGKWSGLPAYYKASTDIPHSLNLTKWKPKKSKN
jgi:elongation factor P